MEKKRKSQPPELGRRFTGGVKRMARVSGEGVKEGRGGRKEERVV